MSDMYVTKTILFLSVTSDTGKSPSARKVTRDAGLELVGRLSALVQTDTDMFGGGVTCVYTGLSHTPLDPFLSRFSPEDTSSSHVPVDHLLRASI